MLAALYLSVHNHQRHPALQIASVIGLTASSLLAYMAARGQLDGPAFWIWALSAAHGSASVLVVRARLESIVAARNSSPDASQRPHRRNALLAHLPPVPLLLLGGGAALLTLAVLYFSVHNYQRHPALQIASVIGLTASSLLAYLAARGQLDGTAFWIWTRSAAHGSASVLVVRARLEAIVAARSSSPAGFPLTHRRHALLAQTGILLLWGALAIGGKPWLILPFLPPLALHGWELAHLGSGKARRTSLRRVGYMQLGASVSFCFLLIAILR